MEQQLKCVQCSSPFEITDNERDFYEGKGLNLPKRCKDCRRKNKEAKRREEEERGY